jgi:peptide/nickel transport system ATP-binding protein/oligopeptide transport system ATP-binding protein
MAPLLEVRNLRTVFGSGGSRRSAPGPGSEIVAVDDVSFTVDRGEVVGIVGESGSGKSVTALSIMGLLPQPPGRVAGGAILFEGQDLLRLGTRARRAVRGGAIGMIFQEPMTSLNPVFTIGAQIIETIRVHERVGARTARARAIDMLGRVGIAAAERRLDDYPHQMSGGMRQRVMIAMALACSPRLLLADEPTTALDVTIQAQLLDLLRDLQREFGMAVVIITHNMGVIAEFAERVVVMYAGRIAEEGPVERIFDAPQHPYTIGLLASTPDLERESERLRTIPGGLPNLAAPPPGCRFAPRCERAIEECTRGRPPLIAVEAAHRAACIRVEAAKEPA